MGGAASNRVGVGALSALGVALGVACSPPGLPPDPPLPPQVSLTVTDTHAFGRRITGTATVSGCRTVTQVQILTSGETFLVDANSPGASTSWEITFGNPQLTRQFAARGLALTLPLFARATCDDERRNTSTPVSVTYFPVESVVEAPGGLALPDVFVAEGGIGGTPTTFIGCVAAPGAGVQLARVDAQANIIRANRSLPFPCSVDSVISDRSSVSLTRWLYEPSVGAFAFDGNLTVTAVVTGAINAIGVGRDGTAVLWDTTLSTERLMVARPCQSLSGSCQPVAGSPIRWQVGFPGMMNSVPIIQAGLRTVWASSWQYDDGTRRGRTVVLSYDLDTGVLLKTPPDVMVEQTFPFLNEPVMPRGAFTPDGAFLALPLLGIDTGGTVRTAVLLCATGASGCQGSARRWTSDFFDGVVSTVLPFANGSALAAAGPSQTWFLSTDTGRVQNRGAYPSANVLLQKAAIRPSGSLVTRFIQPGGLRDFYVLNAPNLAGAFPTELVALDEPEGGELWRINFGSGEAPVSGISMAIDDDGLPWLRVGARQMKPLRNAEYRSVRGPTPLPGP